MPNKTIWDVIGVPPPGKRIDSPAPGTGPTQGDSRVTKSPFKHSVPKTEEPNDQGYGGGGDSIRITGQQPPRTFRSMQDVIRESNQRMPGLAHMGPPGPMIARYNLFYDTHRTRDGWRYLSDDVVTVNFTPAGSGTALFAVNPSTNSGLTKVRLSQYPGAIHLLLCVRTFSYAALAATSGAIEFRFVSSNGDVVPLGIYPANTQTGIQGITAICPTPITDAGIASYGNLVFISSNYGTSAASSAQIGFSFVYVTPDAAFRGYVPDRMRIPDTPDGWEQWNKSTS